jgi:hypothetical protein
MTNLEPKLLILGTSFMQIKNYCLDHRFNIKDILYAYTTDKVQSLFSSEVDSMITLPGVTRDLFQIGLSRMRF